MNNEISLRLLTDTKEIAEAVEFQKLIWGEGDVTSLSHLIATIHNGGVLIGAFLEDSMEGFCFGFPGWDKGEIYLVSHMMAISANLRSRGIGYLLKNKQKEWALQNGYKKIIWTFDPLESRNAYLNVHKLGGYIRTYKQSYYGEMLGDLNKGLDSDRFVLEWDITKEKEALSIDSETIESIFSIDEEGSFRHSTIDLQKEYYKVPVPKNIQQLKKENLEQAKKWRIQLRETFENLFQANYQIVDVIQSTRNKEMAYYIVSKK